jgi:hypothetical protein
MLLTAVSWKLRKDNIRASPDNMRGKTDSIRVGRPVFESCITISLARQMRASGHSMRTCQQMRAVSAARLKES